MLKPMDVATDRDALTVQVRERCAPLLQSTDDEIAIRLLRRDVLGEKASADQLRAWAAEARELGAKLGASWLRTYPTPSEAAQRLGVRIDERDTGLSAGRYVVSEYYTRGRRVVLYRDTLSLLGELIGDLGLGDAFPPDRLRDVALAHELYHWAETAELRTMVRQTFRQPTLVVGPIRITGRVMAANEIVAHAFAQQCCGLTRSPVLLTALLGSAAPLLAPAPMRR